MKNNPMADKSNTIKAQGMARRLVLRCLEDVYEKLLARSALLRANAVKNARLQFDCGYHAGAGDGREHGDLFVARSGDAATLAS
jgi:hypothetical protein